MMNGRSRSSVEVKLRRVELFEGLSQTELERVAEAMVDRHCEPGETLIHHMDASTEVYYVLEGRLRATIHSEEGRETIFRDFGEGEFFGEFAAIDGGRRSAGVSALQPCHVAAQSASDFLHMLETHHIVTLALLRHLTRHTRQLVHRVYELSTKSVRERLYAELLRLGGFGRSTDRELKIAEFPTHAELASRIATHREAVTRELGELANRGIIAKAGKEMILRDSEFLARNMGLRM